MLDKCNISGKKNKTKKIRQIRDIQIISKDEITK